MIMKYYKNLIIMIEYKIINWYIFKCKIKRHMVKLIKKWYFYNKFNFSL